MDRFKNKRFTIGGILLILAMVGAFFLATNKSASEELTAPPIGQEAKGKFSDVDSSKAKYVYFVNDPAEPASSKEDTTGLGAGSTSTDEEDRNDDIKEKLILNKNTLNNWSICGKSKLERAVSHINLARTDCESFTIRQSPTNLNSSPPFTDKETLNPEIKGSHGRFGDLVDFQLSEAAKVAKKQGLRLETVSGLNLLNKRNLNELKDYYVCKQSVSSDIWLEKGSTVVLELHSQRCKNE